VFFNFTPIKKEKMFKNVDESRFKSISIGVTVFIVAVTTFLVFQFSNLHFDYDFEKFFPSNDPETDFFFEHRARFQSDNDFLLIALEREKGVFNEEFLQEVSRFSKKIEKIKRVTFVRSLVHENEIFLYSNGGSSQRPYFNMDSLDLKESKKNIFENEELLNTLISKNGRSLCIYVKHEDFLSKNKSEELVSEIYKITEDFDFERLRMAGRTVGQKYYLEKMGFEMLLFVTLSFLMIAIFLYIAFRSLWGLLLPQVIIVGTLIWVMGFIGWYDEPINVIMSTMPSIIFVVAMSDVIHFLSRYLDAFRSGKGKLSAIKTTIKEVGLATFLTSVTTSIGFFSLYFVDVQPLQAFGFITGVGVLIAFVLTFLLLPVLIFFLPNPAYIRPNTDDPFWKAKLSKWFVWVIKHPKRVLLYGGIVVVVSLIGMSKMETNNYLMDDLFEDEPLKQDFLFLDKNYGGVRPLEIAVTLKDTTKAFFDLDVLREMEKVEDYLRITYKARIVVSLVQTIKIINRSKHAGQVEYFCLPKNNREMRSIRRAIKFAAKGQLYSALIDSNATTSRLSATTGDLGNIEITKRNKAFEDFLVKEKIEKDVDFTVTGTAHLIDKNLNYLSQSLIKGLSISVLIVALIMGLLYRSLSIVLISVVTNLIPLVFVAGVMGYFNIHLKISTAIIFTIAFGIAVDDTIHYLGKFKNELLKGKSVIYSLKRSYLVTGKAMVLTTFILCAGFVLLIFSSFVGTMLMGIMLCMTLMVALIADITILPVLLMLFYKGKKG
jgi:predicted RND superfamily exporter protein